MSIEHRDAIERLPELYPGDTLADRYTVLQVLGSGATSIVYKATDTLANEVVALKVIRWVTPGSDRALDGFRRELTLARKLTHPNVIRIHDIGMDGRVFYIVMEFIDGPTLAQVLVQRGRLDPQQFFGIFHQFAEALRWIHQRNIVHRDVKPSNVMFTNAGVLKVTDFGIAKELGAANSTTRIGTPGYASPEQILGQKLTPASDIYSAGAMFFELLTASRPLGKISLAEQCTLPPPSLVQARPDLPALLCQVVEKCLQPDPANRFQTVDELAVEMTRAEGTNPSTKVVRWRLSALSSDNPAELSQAIPLFLRVVNRVREIHEAGLAHDQLSPRTIYVLLNGEVEIQAMPLPTSTDGTLVSEPKYVSPEAFADGVFSGMQFSIAGDVYALGFMFYERLVGGNEFGKLFVQFNDIEWLRWHADQAKKLPPLRQFRPDCPAKLENLLERMLAKSADERIKSLDEVAGILKELNSSLQETRIEPRPRSGPVTPSPSGELATGIPVQVPRGTGKVVGAVAAVVLIAGVAAMGWKMMRPENPSAAVAKTKSPKETEPAHADVPPVAPPATSSNVLQTATGAMVLLPKDEYKLGDRGTPVTLGPLYVDKYEVTNGSYKKFCSEPGRTCPPPPAWDADYASKLFRPVIGVTWNDADAYCKWAGKRLPSDAEWEAAARGTDQRKYPWGSWMVPGLANLGGGSSEHIADVGSFPVDVSPSGAADMAGNAREWVNDDAPNGQKVVRGGSYDFPADQFTVTWKGSRLPGPDATNTWPVGLRCVAEPEAALKVQAKP